MFTLPSGRCKEILPRAKTSHKQLGNKRHHFEIVRNSHGGQAPQQQTYAYAQHPRTIIVSPRRYNPAQNYNETLRGGVSLRWSFPASSMTSDIIIEKRDGVTPHQSHIINSFLPIPTTWGKLNRHDILRRNSTQYLNAITNTHH